MKKPTPRELVYIACAALLFIVVFRSWDAIVSFLGIVFTAIIPLVLGACIAYIIAIPTNFLERHMFPNSASSLLTGLRKPLCLFITVLLVLSALVFAGTTLIPALKETILMLQANIRPGLIAISNMTFMEPLKPVIHDFLDSKFFTSIESLDFMGMVKDVVGGSVGTFGSQVFTVVSTVATGFFGLLFSFVLLTDTTNSVPQFVRIIAFFLGNRRSFQVRNVLEIVDDSFHNFIVRQCLEAAILLVVSIITLLILGYPYALGVGSLMGLAALIPIVGYPVGLFAGAFMVFIGSPFDALIYLACVALAQVLEATFVLPHVGNPKTALPPVWVTVGVTIGGGVAGFVGMLVAIPIASSIRQLILFEYERRKAIADKMSAAKTGEEPAEQEPAEQTQPQSRDVHARVSELSEGLEETDGDGVGKVE